MLCVWFPEWPLHRPDAPSDRSFLVVEPPPVSTVAAASPDLTDVEIGMPRRQAEGLCPDAQVLVRDREEEARRFEPVIQLVEEIVPRVEVADPGLLFVPLSGAVRYYGGEEEVVDLLAGKLAYQGARLGVADGPFAASLAAKAAKAADPVMVVADTSRFLRGLDVATLAGGQDAGAESLVATFRWLGVTTLGALAALPREAIASRFGPGGIEMHRLAHGEDRVVEPRVIPPELAVEMTFEDPLENLDQVAFVARAASVRLINGLVAEGVAPHRVIVGIEAFDGTIRERVWRSNDALTESALSDRVWWQMRAWLEQAQVPGGVVRLRLDPSELSGDGRQLAFFEDVAARVEAERAVARAQALLGPASILQAEPQGGRMPGERVMWRRWGEPVGTPERDPKAPWPGAIPAPSPTLVPVEPPLLEVDWDLGIPVRVRLGTRWEPVLGWAGPWRSTDKWWKGEAPHDRYQIVTAAGAFLCTVEAGRTRLAGVYD